MARVLVTGAGGFVGRALCQLLARRGDIVRAAVRCRRQTVSEAHETVAVGEITGDTDWSSALMGVEYVLHLAARVHVLTDSAAESALHMSTNVEGTRNLAAAAARAGVRRFVFMSTVKVNGEHTLEHPFTAADPPKPSDSYGMSKWLAEKALWDAAAGHMEGVVVRSPLVYGPGVRANFLRLMEWVHMGVPLPLGAVSNHRSLVSISNLCDLLVDTLRNHSAPGGTWMVSDGEDLSTPDLVRRIGKAMRRRVRLLPVPVKALRCVGILTGRRAEIARLTGSLQVDISSTRMQLGWAPAMSVEESLRHTVDWFLHRGCVS